MEFFRIKKDIPFMRHALLFNAISALTFVAAVFFLFAKGLHLSIEFTGGTVMEVAYTKPADLEGIRKTVGGLGFADSQVQSFGTAQDVLIRLPVQKGASSAQVSTQVIDALKTVDATVALKRVEFVGPQVGEELAHDGLTALAFVVVGIMIYLAFRFEWKFAVAAMARLAVEFGAEATASAKAFAQAAGESTDFGSQKIDEGGTHSLSLELCDSHSDLAWRDFSVLYYAVPTATSLSPATASTAASPSAEAVKESRSRSWVAGSRLRSARTVRPLCRSISMIDRKSVV